MAEIDGWNPGSTHSPVEVGSWNPIAIAIIYQFFLHLPLDVPLPLEVDGSFVKINFCYFTYW